MKSVTIKAMAAALLATVSIASAGCKNETKPAATTQEQTTAAVQTQEQITAADQTQAAASFTPSEVTAAVLEKIEINSAFEKKRESLPDYFDKLDESTVTDFSYYICASGAYPDEIAVFEFDSADLAKAAVPAVEARLQDQKDVYEDYTPDEFYKLEGAIIKQKGNYVYYLVTSDNAAAEEIVKSFISG